MLNRTITGVELIRRMELIVALGGVNEAGYNNVDPMIAPYGVYVDGTLDTWVTDCDSALRLVASDMWALPADVSVRRFCLD